MKIAEDGFNRALKKGSGYERHRLHCALTHPKRNGM